MKTVACMAVHYGKEYIRWAVRGLAEVVDEIHIYYAPKPTFGFSSDGLVCPDTLAEIRAEVEAGAESGPAPFWHEVIATSEEVHRNFMLDRAQRSGADIMVVADADEVWNPKALEHTIRAIYDARREGNRRWLTLFANFWRSFDWMVDDPFRPVRFVDLRVSTPGDAYLTEEMQPSPVYHFGYAQRAELMRYKMAIHGHKAEFRPGWLEEKFFGWKPGDTDTHPACNNLWIPRPTDVRVRFEIDRLLHDHPYHGLAIIP